MSETLLIVQSATIFIFGLVVRDLGNRNKDLQADVEDLRRQIISEIEAQTKWARDFGDQIATTARLKCELRGKE